MREVDEAEQPHSQIDAENEKYEHPSLYQNL